MPWQIRMQADDFFNAYKVLEENEQTVMKKIGKLKGKPLIASKATDDVPTGDAAITCLAFSVELYIKHLHTVVNDKAPKGHNILRLFRTLPKNIKSEIKKVPAMEKTILFYSKEIRKTYPNVDKKGPPITDIFEQQLYMISNAYQEWRYSYERGAVRYDTGFALEFISALRSVANRLQENKSKA